MTARVRALRRRLWRAALAAASDALLRSDGDEAQRAEAELVIEKLRRFVAAQIRMLQ